MPDWFVVSDTVPRTASGKKVLRSLLNTVNVTDDPEKYAQRFGNTRRSKKALRWLSLVLFLVLILRLTKTVARKLITKLNQTTLERDGRRESYPPKVCEGLLATSQYGISCGSVLGIYQCGYKERLYLCF